MSTNPICALGIAQETLSDWRSHLLPADEQQRLRVHIPTCSACQRTLADYEQMANDLRVQVIPEHGPQLWRGVHAQVTMPHQFQLSQRFITTTTGTIAVLLIIALFSAALAHLHLAPIVAMSTPTASVLPISLNQITVSTNVSQGTLVVNGHAQPFSPGNPAAAITLSNQRLVITLQAPPFNPLTCMIDRKQINITGTTGQCSAQIFSNSPALVLDMGFSPDDLPAQQQPLFKNFYAGYLAQLNAVGTTVPAGAHYATGSDATGVPTIASANTPLQARTWVVPKFTQAKSYATDCSQGDLICAFNDQFPSTQPGTLAVSFFFESVIGWRFYTETGDQIAAYQPPTDQKLDLGGFDLYLTYATATGWREAQNLPARNTVAGQVASNNCNVGLSVFLNKQAASNVFTIPRVESSTIRGCLFGEGNLLPTSGPSINPLTDTTNSWFLSQFGALLAVNDLAHALLPQLPRATASEATSAWQASQLTPTP